MANDNKKICPTCGTRVKEDAERCLVCGGSLTGTKTDAQVVSGGKMPEITLGLPIAIGLVVLFLAVGAGMVYLALSQTGAMADTTITPTLTETVTTTPTSTPEPPTPTPSPMPSPTPLTYVVAQNDSCLAIAARFEVSIKSIVLMNNIPASCDTLFEGQELKIPHPTPTATSFPTATLSGIEATIAACDKVSYEVGEGDTLGSISLNYNVPEEAIKSYNGMVSNTVYESLTLIIPLCERAATPGPTPTPTPPPPYPAPNLLLPADGGVFSLSDNQVTLQWSSVGLINTNEAYRITIMDLTEGTGRKLVDYVEDTKFIVPGSFRASEDSPHIYRWTISTVRQVDVDENGSPIWEDAGSLSEARVFTWTGQAAVESTPTP
ncbi:MAG: LysM peptidoglycan-binding domain-containing protein [Anaerolineales bacterium]|nr:LysM peptidoglycan-binding domain-containing protein [Anaerolineales bacterium]